MKNKYRIILFILFLLFSCSGRHEKLIFSVGGAPTELEFWEELSRDFTEESGLEVELLRRPANTEQQRQGLIIALAAEKSHPDVFLMDVAWLSLFAESEWLTPLDDVVDRNDFFKSVIESVDLYKENLVAVPVYMDTGLLYYRKDLLDKFHLPVPETYDSLRDSAIIVQSKLRKKNPDFYGFVWQGMQYEGLVVNFLEFAGADGGFVNSGPLTDGRSNINLMKSANLRALSMMRDFIHGYRISPPDTYTRMREEEVRLYFQSGNALFERNWPYAFSLHNQPGSPVRGKVGVAPIPGQTVKHIAPALGGWHVGVSRYSKKKEDAFRFIRYLASKEVQLKMSRKMGWNPGRKEFYTAKMSINNKTSSGNNPNFNEFRRALEYSFERSRPRPALPYYTQISAILQRHVNGVLAGRTSEKDALRTAQSEVENLVERYGLR